jgi:hypothetical protein
LAEVEENQLRAYVEIEFRRTVVRELRLARTSLLGQHPEVFSEIDRVQSEAEFRGAVVAPLVLGLGAALAWRAGPLAAAISVIAATVLAFSARLQLQRANDLLLEALRLGRAKVPSVDRLEAAISGIKSAG